MNHPDSSEVLADLGDNLVGTFVDAIEQAKDDYQEFRQWRPTWAASSTARQSASFIHDRMWDRLRVGLEGRDDVRMFDQEPTREISIGTRYVARLKRHRPGDQISSYPTSGTLAFWSNSATTLEGLERHSLAFGYMWDPELRLMGETVLSFRDGMENPIWAVTLRRQSGVKPIAWDPIKPSPPELDVSSLIEERKRTEEQ